VAASTRSQPRAEKGCSLLLNSKDYISPLPALVHIGMRLRCALKRIDSVNHRLEFIAFCQLRKKLHAIHV